jgi:hypothetical protein
MFQPLFPVTLQQAREADSVVLVGPGVDGQTTEQLCATPRQPCGTITWGDAQGAYGKEGTRDGT